MFDVGNYGNMLDDTLPPTSSSTPPIFPFFDGQCYYSVPWAESKPCVLLESHWEDVTFRLEALNMLLRIRDRLVPTSFSLLTSHFSLQVCKANFPLSPSLPFIKFPSRAFPTTQLLSYSVTQSHLRVAQAGFRIARSKKRIPRNWPV